ncbi:MAG TPA: GNAT family N-acetyltransferase [Mucilaginibacter sp.]
MNHVLDNPAWNALISGSKNLSNGSESVKYFAKDVSPFVGLKENPEESLKILYDLVPDESLSGVISINEMEIPRPWKLLQCVRSLQLIYNGTAEPDEVAELVTLTDEHIPQMLALTKLTNPGPFEARTIDFGHYRGVFEDNKLVAMAGQRLNPLPYAEISAVCTHPDHLGKGYARRLLMYHVHRIKAAGEIPFLHVRHDNYRAINVYKDLGFETRTEINFYILKKTI